MPLLTKCVLQVHRPLRSALHTSAWRINVVCLCVVVLQVAGTDHSERSRTPSTCLSTSTSLPVITVSSRYNNNVYLLCSILHLMYLQYILYSRNLFQGNIFLRIDVLAIHHKNSTTIIPTNLQKKFLP